jgi:hypothetical protein
MKSKFEDFKLCEKCDIIHALEECPLCEEKKKSNGYLRDWQELDNRIDSYNECFVDLNNSSDFLEDALKGIKEAANKIDKL